MEMDATQIIGAIATGAGVVIAAAVAAYVRILYVRHQFAKDEADRQDRRDEAARLAKKEDTEEVNKHKKEETAAEKKAKRDTIDEYQELIAAMRADREDERKVSELLREDLKSLMAKYAVCEHERQENRRLIEELRVEIGILREVCRRAGLYPWPTDKIELLPGPGEHT